MQEGAKWLRRTFAPLLAKRLPTLYYSGFRHGFIPQFVQQHKKAYPFYLKLDIAKFYPSIPHHALMVEVQLAYKHLLGLRYVPQKFKKQLLPLLHTYFDGLPIAERGLPLNSSLAKALAPLIYTNFLLSLRTQCDCKYLAFVDDFLFLCKSASEVERLYAAFSNFLVEVGLQFNLPKVASGRFANTAVDFCGYRFSGGYVGISPPRVEQFLAEIGEVCAQASRRVPLQERELIKRLNAKINGFGHYYKHGHVQKLYQRLDAQVRQALRAVYTARGYKCPSLQRLERLGLRSLEQLYQRQRQQLAPRAAFRALPSQQCTQDPNSKWWRAGSPWLEKIIHQQAEIIAQLKLLNQSQHRMEQLLM